VKKSPRARVKETILMESSLASRISGMNPTRTTAEVDALLRDLRPWLYRLALAITARPDLAEDAAQEALIRGARSRDKLRQVDEPRAWMRRVVVRCAVDALTAGPTQPETTGTAYADPTESIAVRQTLERLDPNDRAVLALAHFEGLSYAEIAAALEIPSGTVGSRLHAAKEAFRKEWRK